MRATTYRRTSNVRSALGACLLLAAPLLGTGCASLAITPVSLEPYTGVQVDASLIGDGVLTPLAVVDLPLSFAVDTALLPVTIPCKLVGASSGIGGSGRAFD